MNDSHRLQSTLALLFALVALCLSPAVSWAEMTFPTLNSPVMDQANLLSSEQTSQLISELQAIESASSNQIVVVTLPDLQGYTIERFSIELARHWKIGQKDKDNGALLVVAVAEKKVRIEVGYGLEGFLTDATSHSIIYNEIRPAFKTGDYGLGITQGVTAMIGAIEGSYTPSIKEKSASEKLEGYAPLFFLAITGTLGLLKQIFSTKTASGIVFGSILGFIITLTTQSLLFGGLAGIATFLFVSLVGDGTGGSGGSGGSGRSSGSFGGGGFSGGGGGFGGGGASGGW